MSEKKKEKILILTLGTGKYIKIDAKIEDAKLEEALQESIEKKEFNYEPVKYTYNYEPGEDGDTEKIECVMSEFVAEPLIRDFQPQKVIIIGTVKSCWSGFLSKFGDNDIKKIVTLYRIQEKFGIDTKGEELEKVGKEINEIFKNGLTQGLFHDTEVQVIVTRYGINEQELLENYQFINSIGKCLKEDVSYEIAFDITHSFRSLPLYNLIILNYFKQVSKYDVSIRHVYYGNVEVRHEINNIGSIVDLGNLVQVLDLTNGTSEFRNTGNAKTLLSLIPEEEEELKKALEKFDWATQINAFDKVEEALTELMEVIQKAGGHEENPYADLKKMIEEVILKKFFADNGIDCCSSVEYLKLPMEEKQYAICKWYYNQNRYGLAIATAMEALRSYMVPFYLRIKNIEVNQENCENEEHRKAGLDILANIRKNCVKSGENKDYMEQALCQLDCCRHCATQVRNNFAHNLNKKVDLKCSNCKGENEYFEARTVVKQYIFMLDRLRKIIKNNREDVYELCVGQQKKKKPPIHNTQDIRLIVSPTNKVKNEKIAYKKINYEDYTKGTKASKKTYDVYYLNEKIREEINKGISGKDKIKTTVKNAIFLAKYIKEKVEDINNLHVYLCNMDMEQMIYYTAMLKYHGIQHVYENRETILNFGYELNSEKYDDIALNKGQEELMQLDLIQYKK